MTTGRATRAVKLVLALCCSLPAFGTATAGASIPPRNPVRCVATDVRASCGYIAGGWGHVESTRVGPWVVRVWRGSELVWSFGGQTPNSMWIPSTPGDRVEAAIVAGQNLCPPPPGVPAPRCSGAGAVVLTEGLFLL